MTARRTLMLDRLDDVMADVDRLLGGHVTVGNWSLGQICNHLAWALRASVEGAPIRSPWLIRATIGPLIKGSFLRRGRMPTGVRLRGMAGPRPGLDARAEAEALRASIAYYRAHPGPRVAHPIFGRLSPEEWDRFHCIHCAHHLSFAVPA